MFEITHDMQWHLAVCEISEKVEQIKTQKVKLLVGKNSSPEGGKELKPCRRH